jgi:hypothetical protein
MSRDLVPLLAGLVALVVVGQHNLWRLTRTVVTIAHEAGHAVVALLSGRRLSGIRLHSDTSGLTVSRGRPSGPGMVLTALAGYPAPPLLGLGAAALVTLGYTKVLLGAALALLLGTLVYVRNLFGGFAVLLTGGLVGLVGWYGTEQVRLAFCCGVAWFLLLGGLRAVAELRRARRGWPGSDADQLAALTRVPSVLWVGLFVLVAVGSLVLGGWWLVGDAVPALTRT